MSEISWLRERSVAMRAAMDCSDLPDAIDTVLDHLAAVEKSRSAALARVAELKTAARVKPIVCAPTDRIRMIVLCPVQAWWSFSSKMWMPESPSVLHAEYFVPDQSGEGVDDG